MKIHIHIDDAYEGPEIHIYAAEFTEEIAELMKQLKERTQETMIGYLNQDIHVLKIEDIYAIVSENAKVYLQTEEADYESRYKLYEVEENYSKTFARINKSTLINIEHLHSIQTKLGNAQVLLMNEVSFPISRRYLKELKVKLGIGREKR